MSEQDNPYTGHDNPYGFAEADDPYGYASPQQNYPESYGSASYLAPPPQQPPAPVYGQYAAQRPPAPKPASPAAGIVGGVLVLLSSLVLILTAGPTADLMLTATGDEEIKQVFQMMGVAGVAALTGLGGWITCIVATVRDSARPLAVTGLIAGVIGPLVALFMWINVIGQ
ncbi:hypothetical protein [Parenemella sanctibonifatiensis]|uniref:Uncharacterized protein n=1 Tax=Parenemella sanctibonifatiensis TaxID=2016505 RepID=A0A255EIJ8_9ACTN|nr:hypothetical protein [Parenemella sanctibonifatiensis]OYN90801.1 hypothetical protein CGZ91_04670 [Parenemella sanctibonifatiensis]